MQNSFLLKEKRIYYKIAFDEVQYIEAQKRYVKFVTEKKNYLTRMSFYQIEDSFPAKLFCRIHRSFIISLKHIKQIDNNTVIVAGHRLPIGRHYKNEIKEKIPFIESRYLLKKWISSL